MMISQPNIPYRSELLDCYRGAAVVLMIVFHFCWDLREFGYISYRLDDHFWILFRAIILFLFLTAIGWSAYISAISIKTNRQDKRQNFMRRQIQLLVFSGLISAVTYWSFPDKWIFFGILHFIFVANLLIYPIARFVRVCATISMALLILYYFTDWINFRLVRNYLTQHVGLPSRTLDIVYPLPWLACVFIGPLIGTRQWHKIKMPSWPIFARLAWFGRHALPIYLTHQLLLYSSVFLFTWLLQQF
jgi:uncharacterized membrane protein